MKQKIHKIGTSKMIVIPKPVIETLGDVDEVEVTLIEKTDNYIILKISRVEEDV